eukprot:TRINITY_DN154_c0_g1_i1.p1 TRINITY_DN154_c0_g1~~TRINITY_DN154_c0_g1_i1.p1  ORF type:complete len:894 (+),score=172.22 TRINITY_DN154_c0_g1_i1:98-2779(+)
MISHRNHNKNFKVVIRARPPLPRELSGDRPFKNVISVSPNEDQITICEGMGMENFGSYTPYTFTFDHVYGENCAQEKVYNTTAKEVVESSLEGYNATIFAYGQTGTGKTFTMEGDDSGEHRGIIPRAIEQIFQHIQNSVSPRMRFLVRASYLQIYNEAISDLLKPERTNLLIREDKKKGVYVEGLSEWVVRSPAEIYSLMQRGGQMRVKGSTKMNELSSRSHAVFIIIVEQSETTYLDNDGKELTSEQFHKLVRAGRQNGQDAYKQFESNVRQSFKVGKLNLVDLAGSERVRLSGATGLRLEESRRINQSLSALGNVIAALTDPKGRQHIPYRDSKLTRILEDSLGGNCKTTMMAMISPALEALNESLSTLKFGNRAKNIKNHARINEDLDQKSLLRRYERELKRLRSELNERSKDLVDKRRLLEVDEQRRRAEEDKMAAIRALEARSREFMREKEEKRKLEERIQLLTSQMLMGGKVQDTPAFRTALREHQEKIRQEYNTRLMELEKERECIEEEKAQVDRYKQLLSKQRHIMIALTQRLNERDEQIMSLQDEMDAYDKHQHELENTLDIKTAQLIHLQRVTMEHNANSPVKNGELVRALGDWGQNMELPPLGNVAESSIPPKMLMSFRQFRPFEDETLVVTSDKGCTSEVDVDGRLLTANEKITELESLIEKVREEASKMAIDLEEVRAEKVSMEYLLREKLEKLVQAELDARLAHGQHNRIRSDGTIEEIKDRIIADTPSSRERGLQSTLDMIKGSNAEEKRALIERTNQLEKRIEIQDKERQAIQTIMELKIKSLVDGISSKLEGVDISLRREVNALQRLVHASVSALRNANTSSTHQSSPKTTPRASYHPRKSETRKPDPRKSESKRPSNQSIENLIQQRKAELLNKY